MPLTESYVQQERKWYAILESMTQSTTTNARAKKGAGKVAVKSVEFGRQDVHNIPRIECDKVVMRIL